MTILYLIHHRSQSSKVPRPSNEERKQNDKINIQIHVTHALSFTPSSARIHDLVTEKKEFGAMNISVEHFFKSVLYYHCHNRRNCYCEGNEWKCETL